MGKNIIYYFCQQIFFHLFASHFHPLKQFIKDYLSFNKRERNGIFVLLIILAAIILLPFIFPFFISEKKTDFSLFRDEIIKFEASLKKNGAEKTYGSTDFDYNNIDRSAAENILHPFYFDPNEISAQGWKEIGFDDKQVKIIMNYRSKGGKFYKKDDLKKIYGITASEYALLEPYIRIPEKSSSAKDMSYSKNEKNTEVIELNSADTSDLKKLKGIGSWYARKIIAYRVKLGGFVNKEQLLEIKGIDSAKYAGFSEFVSINKFLLKTININSATYDELRSHPYIGNNIASSLVNYRSTHGKFHSVADILKDVIITQKVFQKISPYLTVE
jgi:competence protein ComEA